MTLVSIIFAYIIDINNEKSMHYSALLYRSIDQFNCARNRRSPLFTNIEDEGDVYGGRDFQFLR